MIVEVCGCYGVLLTVNRSDWWNMGENGFV